MGAVYRAFDVMLERDVAIKVLRPELAAQRHIVERFRAEAVTLAKLNHPNIAALHAFINHAGQYLMVMEYMEGVTLEEKIKRDGAMEGGQAIKLFAGVLEGVAYAHKRGVIHRDLKSANVMLTGEGVLKVMDFGIARVLGAEQPRLTRAGCVVGTIEYMSPEQVRGEDTNERSDIYSLGMLLYEIVTGRLPFASGNEYELMRMQIEDAPPDPRRLARDTPPEIANVILRALEKNPDHRFQSAAEFRRALIATNYLTDAPPDAFAEREIKSDDSLTAHSFVTRPSLEAWRDHRSSVTQTSPSNAYQTTYLTSSLATSRISLSSPTIALDDSRLNSTVPAVTTDNVNIGKTGSRFPRRTRQLKIAFSTLTWKHYGVAVCAMLLITTGALSGIFNSSSPKRVADTKTGDVKAAGTNEAGSSTAQRKNNDASTDINPSDTKTSLKEQSNLEAAKKIFNVAPPLKRDTSSSLSSSSAQNKNIRFRENDLRSRTKPQVSTTIKTFADTENPAPKKIGSVNAKPAVNRRAEALKLAAQ